MESKKPAAIKASAAARIGRFQYSRSRRDSTATDKGSRSPMASDTVRKRRRYISESRWINTYHVSSSRDVALRGFAASKGRKLI